ncbi:MAG: glycosyltransferase family 2 protein [Alphaproteobacteria bacterium]
MDRSAGDGLEPTLSVVTVNRNMRAGLAHTIESVRRSTATRLEHVVIDGASTDGSRALLESAQAGLRWWSEADGGIYDAMNKGVARAAGTWVLFLNAGDVLDGADALAPLQRAMREADTADILYGDVRVAYPDGTVAARPARPLGTMPQGMPFAHAAAAIRRDLLIARPYETDGQACDYAFFLRCWAAGRRFRYVPGAVATIEAGGVSDRRRVRSTVERWRAVRRADLVSAPLAAWYAAALMRAALAPPLARMTPRGLRRRLRGALPDPGSAAR